MRWPRLVIIGVAFSVAAFALTLSAMQTQNDSLSRALTRHEFPLYRSPVVRVLQRSRDDEDDIPCSGVLVSENVVLTAYHCVAMRPALMRAYVQGRPVRVRKVTVHPDARFDEHSERIFDDIALLTLSHPASVRPLPVLASVVPQRGDQISFWGYGFDLRRELGQLHSGIGRIRAVRHSFISTRFNGEGSDTCDGDSGGPLILSIGRNGKDPEPAIIGVTSTGTKEDCGVGDVTFYPNLQAPEILSFLESNVPGIRIL